MIDGLLSIHNALVQIPGPKKQNKQTLNGDYSGGAMDGPSGLATFMNPPEPPAYSLYFRIGRAKYFRIGLSSSYMSACGKAPQQLSTRNHLLVNSVHGLGKYSDEGVALDLCPARKRTCP